jgi:alpha/beta superfamily hydrolase
MAAVVFAFGSHTGLAAHEAEEIAVVLAAHPEPAAQSAAAKIREQAAFDPSTATGHEVELDPDELRQLAAVLETMRSQTDFRVSLGRLHADVAAALGR